jgi:hypothetical protein
MTIDELKESVIEGLTTELESDPDFSDEILEQKVDNVINEVKQARRYAQAGYSDEQIEADIVNYISNIRNLTLYDYNQSGIDFQTTSQENGTSRSFMSRHRLFYGIIPLAKQL